MAEISPFCALRYDPERVPLADVVTQPYDKITPEMQARYYRAHPCNLVRIILGNPELEAGAGQNVYQNAAAYLRDWRQSGVLRAEAEPAFYAYWQRFKAPGSSQELERRGFIGLGRLYDYSEGVVFRHEQTLAKPKQDRLNLLRATRAHGGQLFMLYSDPERQVERALAPAAAPEIDLRDEYGVQHQVWRISGRDVLARMAGLMADKKLLIADGHHRYETALAYRNERRTEQGPHLPEAGRGGAPARENLKTVGPGASPGLHLASPESLTGAGAPARASAPYEFVMMTFINMDAPGLVILPTHRVVFGLAGFDKDLFLRSAFPYFNLEPFAATDPTRLTALLHHAGQQGTAFVAAIGREAFLLRTRPGAADSLLAGLSPRQRLLDVAQLHKIVLEHVLGISEEAIRQQQNIAYLRDPGEAIERARSGANVALLMNAVAIERMREVAFAGEVMPQKSTDFYPKLLSGLTIYALD